MSKSTEIQLVLIPAAATEWDESGRLQGGSDLPASASGLAAAKACVESAAALNPAVVLSAPDEASVQTAKLLAKHVGVKVRTISALADPSLGLWEGLAESAALERYPTVYKQWRQDPSSVHPPEGEAFDHAVHRITSGLVKAIEKSSKESYALALRPAAYRIVSRWAAGAPIVQDWRAPQANEVQTFTLSRAKLRQPPNFKATANAS